MGKLDWMARAANVAAYLYFAFVFIAFAFSLVVFALHYGQPQQLIADVYALGFSVLIQSGQNDFGVMICFTALLLCNFGLLLGYSAAPGLVSWGSKRMKKENFFSKL
jgi:hypothetical protein